MRGNLIDGEASPILESRHHLGLLGVRLPPIGAPDLVGRALCGLLGGKTGVPAVTDRGLFVPASLVHES